MKVDLYGYEVECTPQEFSEFLKLQSELKPSLDKLNPQESGYWSWGDGIYPPAVTCINISSDSNSINLNEFMNKLVESLNKKGIRIGKQ
jgi:hypothetical protein